MPGPAAGLRVLDFSQSFPGALATMVLADSGAEVIKIEPPGGDPTRRHYASVMWHRGKKSVVIDLGTPEGREAAQGLASSADVVIHTLRPGVAERLGIGYETLSDSNPELVYCAISGFGTVGPYAHYKGYEGIVAAKTGWPEVFQGMGGKKGPVYAAVPVASYAAAMSAVQGIMAGLYVREQTGRGQKVETSLLQALMNMDVGSWLTWQINQEPGGNWARRMLPGYLVAQAKDGQWLQLGNLPPAQFRSFLEATELTHLYEDPRFASLPRVQDEAARDEVMGILLSKMRERTADEWMKLFLAHGDVAGELFHTTQEGLNHAQVLHNRNVIELDDPVVGKTRQLGPLARFAETPASPQGPAPALGQHTEEVLKNGAWVEQRSVSGKGSSTPAHPLTGVTVLEFATYIAVPTSACLLADLGARVIKVEPLTGDLFRANFPSTGKLLQTKESLALNLRTPEGQEAIHKLIAQSDILVHNYRPGVPERLKIDYETARGINPRLIYAYGASYGSSGPHAHRPAMHPIAGAISGGARYQMGQALPPKGDALSLEELAEASEDMLRTNQANPDPNSGVALAAAMLLALYARERTGKGQYLETWMLNSNLYANAHDALWYEGKPERLLPDEDFNGLHALYRMYQARTGWVFLACVTDGEWHDLTEALGMAALRDDSRFADAPTRIRNSDELAELLAPVFMGKEANEWERELVAKDVACVEVREQEIGSFFDQEPFVKEAGFWREVSHPALEGPYWRHGTVWTFSETPGRVGPMNYIGEHTQSILEELGYGDSDVQRLKEQGVATWPDA